MQNRYVGDIGDYAKFGLLRALSEGESLGVAWYLFPDESHNQDGGHINYLLEPEKWRTLDAGLFDGLNQVVHTQSRNVSTIEQSGLLGTALYHSELLHFGENEKSPGQQRAGWFRHALKSLEGASLIFADPDNGLCKDNRFEFEDENSWKRMPLSEAHVLTAGRTGVFYHHNSRFRGGHYAEIHYWMRLLGPRTWALYWRRFSNRTFFITNPTADIKTRVLKFAKRWTPHFELVTPQPYDGDRKEPAKARPSQLAPQPEKKRCPECGHAFSGGGWSGIDAHWKAHHEYIMPYADAWPLIQAGKQPSLAE